MSNEIYIVTAIKRGGEFYIYAVFYDEELANRAANYIGQTSGHIYGFVTEQTIQVGCCGCYCIDDRT